MPTKSSRNQGHQHQIEDGLLVYHPMEKDDGHRRSSSNNYNNHNTETFDEEYDYKKENNPDDDDEEVYIVRQDFAYGSYIFSASQCIIMMLLLWQCGMAPFQINPMIGPFPDALSEWGGKNAVLILQDGEWWRLITPILLHAGLLHLFANVSVQIEAGAFFEKEWGTFRWLVVYLTSAVVSSVMSVIFMPQAVSVGSSGACMGLFGAKLAEVVLRCAERDDTAQAKVSRQVRKEQCISVTCSVIIVMAFSFIPYVDWAAHLGGLIGGLVVGFVIFAFDLELLPCKIVWVLIGLGMTITMFVVGLRYMYEEGNIEIVEELRDVCGYYKQQFQDYECRCMKEEMMQNNGEGGDKLRLF